MIMYAYAPFKFFIVDEKDMYTVQPTLINNTDEKVGLQIEHSKDVFCKKQTNKQKLIWRLLIDLETIVSDMSRGGNQTSY